VGRHGLDLVGVRGPTVAWRAEGAGCNSRAARGVEIARVDPDARVEREPFEEGAAPPPFERLGMAQAPPRRLPRRRATRLSSARRLTQPRDLCCAHAQAASNAYWLGAAAGFLPLGLARAGERLRVIGRPSWQPLQRPRPLTACGHGSRRGGADTARSSSARRPSDACPAPPIAIRPSSESSLGIPVSRRPVECSSLFNQVRHPRWGPT